MSMNIKNERVHVMAAELARLRGTSITQAVHDAVEHELDMEKRRLKRNGLAQEIIAFSQRFSGHFKPGTTSEMHNDLYGEDGLPE